MADFLIQHLKKKASEHSALEMLVNQWGFDEKLIPKALQTIGNLFPHYSRHDVSHSKQILINIERLLGEENIGKLTATDTWLLLESAYWHDIGMVVPQKDIAEAFGHIDFPQYIEKIRNAPNHELHHFSISFNSHDIAQCFNGADTPMDAVDKFRQLMAEWFRQQHANRASEIIQAPWTSVGISSPRTELIPARLFKLLGRICHMHGLPFIDLLAPNGLPYCEAGLAQEDCHPRFIACLLRMGDLLDLDDNRFCPVMQRIAGENRSQISKAHEDKHTGLRHLRVDQDRIEITAECETIDGYLETFKWFDWLKQEMQDQMAHWQDIVPSRQFGLLPTLGDIVVRLSGEQQILKEGQRPQFSVDGKQAINLLQGNNLYSSKFACVRELLQNAVDATLLHLWLTNEKKENADTWKTPSSEGATAILKSGFIEVKLDEIAPDADTPTDKTRWILQIIDCGTGISRDDLGYMLRIGGSQGNMPRKSKINDMPEWMKPSGDFGIGFQSVFLICDVVKLTTKSIFTNEMLEVTMYSPTGNEDGLVILKPLSNDFSRPCGTAIEIIFSLEKISRSSYSRNPDDIRSIAVQFLTSYDPVLDESLPIEAAQLADQIQKFSANAPLPIRGQLTSTEKSTSFQLGTADDTFAAPSQSWRFVEVNGHQVTLQYKPVLRARAGKNITTLYRGQPVEQKGFYLPNVHIEINLLSGKAGKWLTANRDMLVNSAVVEFKELVLSALEKLVKEDLTNVNTIELLGQELKPVYSFFLEAMAVTYGNSWVDLAKKLEGTWLDLEIPQKTGTYRSFFDQDSWTLLDAGSFGIKSNINKCDLILDFKNGYYQKRIIINEWLKIENRTVQVICSGNDLMYQLENKPQPSYSADALATKLEKSILRFDFNERFFLDFQDTYSALHLKDINKICASYLFDIPPRNKKFVLLPFLFHARHLGGKPSEVTATSSQLDALCKWIEPHLETPASLVEIRQAYEDLIRYIDNKIMQPSPHWQAWKTARGID